MNRSVFLRAFFFVSVATISAVSGAQTAKPHTEGYRDTPILPGQKWHVHDVDRPYPHEVSPGSTPGAPPADAIVLFDGKNLSHWFQWEKGKRVAPKWKVRNGLMEVNGGTGSLYSQDKFGDCQFHIEWQEPKDVKGTGQGRGNSGVFFMSRYEVQVLDSYRSATYADGQAGAIYGQWPPLVNPQRKPGEWQSYDIIFESPKFEGDRVVTPAYMTVFFNGVLVHHHQKLNGETQHGVVLPYTHHEVEESMYLQDHGHGVPIHYRNIWFRKLKGYDQPE